MEQDTESRKYTYFVTGGGTGGHVYPAIAVAKKLALDETTKKIYFIGNPKKLEYKVATQAGFEFLPVNIEGMPAKPSFAMLKWFFQLELTSWRSLFYIWKYKPDAIFGTGGYVSSPALFAATIAKVPFMIHDCDALPGKVSRLVAPAAKKVSVAFKNALDFFDKSDVSFNGNPIDDGFFNVDKQKAKAKLGFEDKLTLLAMGGSQGALTINKAVIEASMVLLEKLNLQLIIQTGIKNYSKSEKLLNDYYPEAIRSGKVILKPYFDNMSEVLGASDIVIARAGSMSLSEICASGVASILVPYPYASADHQRRNAKQMEKDGASIYVEDADFTAETLLAALTALVQAPQTIERMQGAALRLAKPHATTDIVEQLKQIVK